MNATKRDSSLYVVTKLEIGPLWDGKDVYSPASHGLFKICHTLPRIVCVFSRLLRVLSRFAMFWQHSSHGKQRCMVAVSPRLITTRRGWSGGAMVLGKLSVPGRPTIWIIVGQGPIALAVGAVGGCLGFFTLLYPFFPLSPSLWETARYRLKYCLKGPLNPKQSIN